MASVSEFYIINKKIYHILLILIKKKTKKLNVLIMSVFISDKASLYVNFFRPK